MFQNKKLTVSKILNVILILMAVFCLCYGLINIAYANTQMNKPDVNIYITDDGRTVCEGSLFGNDLWYPGKTIDGVIRVNNNYGPVELKGMKVDVLLNKVDSGRDRDSVYASFMNNMIMTVKKGKLLVFSDILFENRSLSQLAVNQIDPGASGEESGFDIQKDDFIDLNYTLHMNEESGEELENMSADIDISLDFTEAVEAE
jgi:hypothetical protein